MHYNPTSLTRTAGILALGSFLTLALYGCGGGSSSTSNAPSREVKVRIKQMISGSFVAMTNSGLQTPNAAHNLNSSAGLPPRPLVSARLVPSAAPVVSPPRSREPF